MMSSNGDYKDYAQRVIEQYAAASDRQRSMLLDEIDCANIETVLDVGCGAGQELLPFAEKTRALCIGIDVGREVGEIGQEVFRRHGFAGRAEFFRAQGEHLPFADASFDTVICRVALPYMDNRKALAEMSRVLKPHGKFFLKIHAPKFYYGMIRRRIGTLNPKQVAYPVFSLLGGSWSILTGQQPAGGFWAGKEIFQTKRFLRGELAKNNLRITKDLPDTNAETPSYLIEKVN